MCVQVGGCVGFCERYNCSACAGAYVRKLELAFSLTLMTASDSPTSSVMIPVGVCTKICFGLYLRKNGFASCNLGPLFESRRVSKGVNLTMGLAF